MVTAINRMYSQEREVIVKEQDGIINIAKAKRENFAFKIITPKSAGNSQFNEDDNAPRIS